RIAETRTLGWSTSGRRGPEPSTAALAPRELLGLDESHGRDRHDDELRDAHARLDRERVPAVGVEEHDAELAPIAGVDEAGRVHDPDPVLRGEAGPGLDEPGEALGDLDRYPGAYDGACAGLERRSLAGGEIEPRVALVGAARHDRVVPKLPDADLDHRAVASADGSSATRNSAKRATSRRGRRARTRTPSGVSRRSAIGAPRS